MLNELVTAKALDTLPIDTYYKIFQCTNLKKNGESERWSTTNPFRLWRPSGTIDRPKPGESNWYLKITINRLNASQRTENAEKDTHQRFKRYTVYVRRDHYNWPGFSLSASLSLQVSFPLFLSLETSHKLTPLSYASTFQGLATAER